MSATTLFAPLAAAPRPKRGLDVGALARLALGDVRERVRRPAYLVALLVMVWIGQHMLAPAGASYRTCVIAGDYRPFYGAAWVGALAALLTNVYFLFVGFYQVKGSIERDRRTGVGQILASTRMGKARYLVAKTLSHAAVLLSMGVVTVAAVMVSQVMLGEDSRIDLAATLVPYVTFTVPVALFVSAFAVLFECVPFLAKGLGNIAWFFFIGALLSTTAMDKPNTGPYRDLLGGATVVRDVIRVCHATYPRVAFHDDSFSMGVNMNPAFKGHVPERFRWSGLAWTFDLFASRILWIGIAFLIVLAATWPFDRFSRAATTRATSRSRPWWVRGVAAPAPRSIVPASRLTVARRAFRVDRVLRAELAILLKGCGRWWWIVTIGMAIAQVFVPLEGLRTVLLPIVSLWPVLAWSAMGQRERSNGTAPLLFSCPRPVSRLLPAAWLAGALLFAVVAAPALVRLAIAGDGAAAGGWLLGAAGVSAFALASGIWTGSGKLFEVTYLFLWYVGPMHHVMELDYTGVTATRSAAAWSAFATITGALLVLAWIGRIRQVRG